MPHWPKPLGYLQNEESLQRMQEILSRLDNPHKKFPKTVHVAGTNGKGSTIAFLKAMLEAAGNKVHVYTTPHILEFNERIILAGKRITDQQLFEAMDTVRLASEGIKLGFYEATTAGAMLAFSEVEADYLLLETGMGGRLDVTNVIEEPFLTILTTIEKDHTVYLGTELPHIAYQKVHIVKENGKCVSSLQHDNVYPIIEAWCAEKNVEYTAFGFDYAADKNEEGLLYQSQDGEIQFPKPALLGDHQYVNAATAITAAIKLGLSKDEISDGVKNARWPSRLEKIKKSYIPDGWEFWIDGAHNPSSANALAQHIKEEWQDKPTYLIYGTTRGRDIAEFLSRFQSVVSHISCVKVHYEPDAYDGEEILVTIDGAGTAHHDIKDAVNYITESFPQGRILCCGSLFMRGDI